MLKMYYLMNQKASDYFDYLKSNFFPNDNYFCERSWGMSSDYLIAIQNKSTLVRIGTAVFELHEYTNRYMITISLLCDFYCIKI